MLYIGTDRQISAQRRDPLTVEAVALDVDARLAPAFDKPFRRFVGVDGGCSCDFPYFPFPGEYFAGLFEGQSDAERERSVACVRSLLGLVADALKSSDSVEIYAAWADQEALPPAGRIVLRVQDLVPERFFFVERYLYEVRAA